MTRTHASIALTTLAALGLATATPQSARAQNIENPGAPDVFSPSDTVTVSSSFPYNTVVPGNLVDQTNHSFVFGSGTTELASVTGFNSAISSLRFFDTPTYQGRTANGVTIYYSANQTTSLSPSDYTMLGVFNLPTTGNYYQTTTDPQETQNPNDPYVDTTKIIHYDTLTGLAIPAGTQSVLFAFPSTSGDGLSEIQAFAPAPEPSQTAALGLGVLGLAGLAFKAHRRRGRASS